MRVWRRTSPAKINGANASSVRSPATPRTPSSSGAARGLGDCRTDSGECGAGDPDEGFLVDRLIAMANTPGQLRAEALCLLTRIGRSYPSHVCGESVTGEITEEVKKVTAGDDEDDHGHDGENGSSCRRQEEPISTPSQQRQQLSRRRRRTWENVSGLLLRCFADPDQNLRLHALKVLEAFLLARSEQAATAVVGMETNNEKESNGRVQAAAEDKAPASACGVAVRSAGGGVGGGGGSLWGDLVQKHLQRALEDPYHGVRAVACACHGCLLDSDWEAFADDERDQCLDRLLAATRDRAAGKLLARAVESNFFNSLQVLFFLRSVCLAVRSNFFVCVVPGASHGAARRLGQYLYLSLHFALRGLTLPTRVAFVEIYRRRRSGCCSSPISSKSASTYDTSTVSRFSCRTLYCVFFAHPDMNRL